MSFENEIPKGWLNTTLVEVGKLARGKSKHRPRWAPHLFGGKYPFIQTGQVKFADKYIKTYEQTYSEAGLAQSKLWDKNTLCITIAANIAEIAILKFPACFPDSVLGFIANDDKCDLNFIYYNFTVVQAELRQLAIGSVQDNINLGTFENLQFLLPPLSEQKAIANILTAFDDKIELLKQQNTTLETIAQTIFKEWFGKYQLGDELPEGWRIGNLGGEFDITIGRTPPRIEQEWFSKTPTGKKWISIKDIGNSGIYIFNTSEFLTDEAIKKFNIPVIPKSTTILSFKMTVGKLSITSEDMLSNEAIAHLKLKGDTILSSEFIYLYLQKLDFNALGSTSSIVTAINSRMIKAIEFIIPNKEILLNFNEAIKPLFNKIKFNTEQIQTLMKTRDELLPKLMSGQVRVKM